MWARANLQSRAFSFRLSNEEEKVLFCPSIAVANHHDKKFCSVSLGNGITYPEETVIIRTTETYYPGEDIFISYGDLSFQQKLLSFGWIDRDVNVQNPHKFCLTPITVSSMKNDESKEFEIKTEIHGLDDKQSISKDNVNQNALKKEVKNVKRKISQYSNLNCKESLVYLNNILLRKKELLLQAKNRLDLYKNDVNNNMNDNLSFEALSLLEELDDDIFIVLIELQAVKQLIPTLEEFE